MDLYSATHSEKYKQDATYRAMVNDSILSYYDSDQCDGIYGYIFGAPWIWTIAEHYDERFVKHDGRFYRHDEIRHISKHLDVSRDNDAFFYVWGGPGPDYNKYEFKDYGITWAFSESEIRDVSIEEWVNRNECENKPDV